MSTGFLLGGIVSLFQTRGVSAPETAMTDTNSAATRSATTDQTTPRFSVTDYPEVLRRVLDTAYEARGTKTVEYETHLIGLTTDGVAVYFDEFDRALLEVVPAHSDRHDTSDAGDPVRNETRNYQLGAPAHQRSNDFHTLPNGDHLVIINREGWRRPYPQHLNPPGQYDFETLSVRYADAK